MQRSNRLEQTRSAQLFKDGGRGWTIKVQERNRICARSRPAQRKVRDVHVVFAHRLTQCPDDAGNVGVGGIEHVRAHLGVDVDAFDLDETRLAVREYGACDGTLTLCGFDHQLDVSVKCAGGGGGGVPRPCSHQGLWPS